FAYCDVVFTSNITSAAVDACCAGIPVVQMLDGYTFNMSPLRGLKGVMYVANPIELAKALLNARYRESLVVEPYFYLDGDLPRWMQLLELKPEYAE
ncbi:MAG: carbohydrate biosynthesis protein, partial [Proteobacteria bacterium]|nr:carbohydrate biosynthesis protein [Pseudomonadota bacterium]